VLYLTREGGNFRSKRGNVLKQFEALCAQVRRQLAADNAILDGEVIALDAEGRQDSRALLSRRGDLHYTVFDVLWLNGKDRTTRPLTTRKRLLERLIPVATPILSKVFMVEGRRRDLFRAAEQLDLEGIVAKRKADPYTPDTVWYKIKNRAYTQMEGRGELFHPTHR
jgi:bifunctional non-homologous end joining protein LigD